jgi:ubiquinone/menaquinone biosynthesis C-methylase UbiE
VTFYRDRIVPRLVNLACGTKANEALRRQVCAGLHGRVIEIGFGSGLNVPFYPRAVDQVDAVEPADLAWKMAGKRIGAARTPVTRAWLDGQSLPFRDATYETALSTWTLCTIPDVDSALHELVRVLKPGGVLHFVEHGLAPHDDVRRWQHRLEPVQKRLAGGCHLTRPVTHMLKSAGFTITQLDEFYEPGIPKSFGALAVGEATTPLTGGLQRPQRNGGQS